MACPLLQQITKRKKQVAGDEAPRRENPMETIPEIYAMMADSGSSNSEISQVERLVNEFEAHESQEGTFLKQYKELAAKTDNRLVKFLLQMIVSDEEKHHAITRAMAATLKSDIEWTKRDDAIQGLYDLPAEKDKLLELTEDFITIEKQGISEYKALIHESKGYYRDLFVLLFRSMICDSEKHIEILDFLRNRLKET
jgi:NADH dehydrogenase/NADH:ubiquinone oxidoreductase subunit G